MTNIPLLITSTFCITALLAECAIIIIKNKNRNRRLFPLQPFYILPECVLAAIFITCPFMMHYLLTDPASKFEGDPWILTTGFVLISVIPLFRLYKGGAYLGLKS